MISRRGFAFAVLFLVCACASSGGTATPRPARNTNVLTEAEVQARPGLTLYQLIERDRPDWLRIRRRTSVNAGEDAIVVYRDDVRQGGLAVLRDMTVESVSSIRFITGPEADGRFGRGHQSGAILITSRKR